MAKICYSIGEVADQLGESVSLVRFWSDTYPEFIHPDRNKKGNRLFSPEDIDNFKKLHLYIKDRGMTLEGARKMMKSNAAGSDSKADVALKLQNIRNMLQQIHDQI